MHIRHFSHKVAKSCCAQAKAKTKRLFFNASIAVCFVVNVHDLFLNPQSREPMLKPGFAKDASYIFVCTYKYVVKIYVYLQIRFVLI